MNRRHFLKQVEIVSGGALCGVLAMATACGAARGVGYLTPTLADGRAIVPLASLDASGDALVEVPGSDLPIYIRRSGTGAFSAVSTRCMHRGCQVEAGADRLICPCHGSEYDYTGAVLRGPTELPLVRYRVSSDATNLYIHLVPAEAS